MEHTKGDWEVALKQAEITGDYFVTSDNELTIIATVHKMPRMEDSTFRHEAEANAHIIAAAPDLLNACKELVHRLRWVNCPEDERVLANRSIEEGDKAIAKAERS